MSEEFIFEKEPEFHGDREWYEKELRDRLRYFYGQIDGRYKFPNNSEGDLLRMTWKLLFLLEGKKEGLFHYKKEDDMDVLESIVEKKEEDNYFKIDLDIRTDNEKSSTTSTPQFFNIIHLVFIDKKTFKETRTPLAYYIGERSKEVLEEEKALLIELTTRLYNCFQSE